MMSKRILPAISPARSAVVDVLTQQVRSPHDMPPLSPDISAMEPRDARLAVAIHRACLQHWLTLEYLLKQCAHRWPRKMQADLEASLLAGAAQLLFMEKLPAHAVVHESVELVKRRVRREAAAFANAVLRKFADLIADRHDYVGYRPSVTSLPWQGGHITLSKPLLPPLKEVDRHYSIATSHPLPLVRRWRERYGDERTLQMLLHSLEHAPTIVHDAEADPHMPPDPARLTPHEQPNFYVWQGDHDSLRAHLAESTARWVQDPASATPARSTADLQPRVIVDYCAGRGTKTRQLARLHPGADVLASDPDAERLADLKQAFADHPRVTVLEHDQLRLRAGEADLLVLDVPCSNTGVLARRLEARYRFGDASLASVVALQREIVEASAPLLRAGGHLLYATCSLEPEENEQQAQFAADHLHATITHEQQILPAGRGATYHDGSYHALLER